MTVGAVIFTRMSSSRLPGKALIPIGPRPLLGHVIDRARLIDGDPPVVVATSDATADDPIAAFAEQEGAETFRGSLNDVARRAYDCATAFGFEGFIRICGDRPLFDPMLASECLAMFRKGNWDLVTNTFPATYGPGLTVEVLRTSAIGRCINAGLSDEEREHVTPYFYSHPQDFSIRNVGATEDYHSGVKLTVDDAIDLARIRWIVSQLGANPAIAPLPVVAALSRQWEIDGNRSASHG